MLTSSRFEQALAAYTPVHISAKVMARARVWNAKRIGYVLAALHFAGVVTRKMNPNKGYSYRVNTADCESRTDRQAGEALARHGQVFDYLVSLGRALIGC